MLERFLNRLQPIYGSIVSTGLTNGLGEFAGIFMGDGQVMTLLGQFSRPQLLSLEEFGLLPPIADLPREIVVSFDPATWKAASFPEAAARAQELYKGDGDYRLLLMNSHQFCSSCLTGNFNNMDIGLAELKQTIASVYPHKLEWRKPS